VIFKLLKVWRKLSFFIYVDSPGRCFIVFYDRVFLIKNSKKSDADSLKDEKVI